jgi:hypothetical protein
VFWVLHDFYFGTAAKPPFSTRSKFLYGLSVLTDQTRDFRYF